MLRCLILLCALFRSRYDFLKNLFAHRSALFRLDILTARIFQRFTFLSLLAPRQGPEVVIVHDSSSTSLVLRWSHLPKEYFQGQPIGYKIAYNPVDFKSNIHFVSVNYTTNSTALTNLTVYTTYIINVSAVSSGGIGPAKTVKAKTGAEGMHVVRK